MGSAVENLAELFNKFPGIGPRQAKRFVYFLLSQNDSFTRELINSINQVKQETKRCVDCFRLSTATTDNLCRLCGDTRRDNSKLMVVAKDIDLENIERSGFYDGKYFVLGGLLPILEKNPEEKIRLRELTKRAEVLTKNQPDLPAGKAGAGQPSAEIIIALSANTEGDYTSDHLTSYLSNLSKDRNIKISLLGRGLSTGTELEYSDSDTIINALKNRQ